MSDEVLEVEHNGVIYQCQRRAEGGIGVWAQEGAGLRMATKAEIISLSKHGWLSFACNMVLESHLCTTGDVSEEDDTFILEYEEEGGGFAGFVLVCVRDGWIETTTHAAETGENEVALLVRMAEGIGGQICAPMG